MSSFMKMVTIGLSDTQLQNAVGTPGSIIYNSTTGEMHLMDGVTPGGQSLATDSEVNSTLASVTASGGQVLPTLGTPTSAGNVVVWDGNAWDESGDFALTADVNQKFTDLSPATGNSTTSQFLQWNNGKLVNTTIAGGGGGGGVHAPATSTGSNGVLQYDVTAADWVVSTAFALSSDVANDISSAITGLKGATTTYNTLKLAEDAILNNNSRISSIQTLLGNKPDIPSRGPNSGETLTWDSVNGVFDYSSAFATDADVATKANKPGASSTTTEVLAWDAAANSGEGAFLQKDMSVYAQIGSATTFTDLGLVETNLNLKAPKPPNGIQAGEFLRWDETNGVFTFATPAGGGGGSSIPTPATTTDYTTAGAMQVLIWDQSSGDLKNVASPFVEPPPASAAGEYLRWDAATGWVNDTPAVGSSGVAQPPDSAAGEFLRWNPALNSGAGDWENLIPDSINAPATATPASSTVEGWALTYDGSGNLVNSSGYAMIGTSSYTSLEDVETALNSAMSSIPLAAPNQPAANQYLYADHIGAWQYGDLSDLVANNTADTPADHVLVYNSTSKQLETKSWDLAGPLEVVDNGTEYVIQIKASLGL